MVVKVTIIPAIKIPREMARYDFLLFKLKNHASKAPEYAPVIGSGTETKIINAQNSNFVPTCFSNFFLLDSMYLLKNFS